MFTFRQRQKSEQTGKRQKMCNMTQKQFFKLKKKKFGVKIAIIKSFLKIKKYMLYLLKVYVQSNILELRAKM